LKFLHTSSIILVVLIVFVLLTLSLVVVLALSLLVGWILSYFLAFTLFEGTLLGLIALGIVGMVWYNILISSPDTPMKEFYDDETDELDEIEGYDEIPAQRFYKNQADQTWEAWFRYQIANSIYTQFQDSPRPVGQMGDKQLQELAVRLADLATNLCKREPVNTKTVQVTVAAFKKEMNKIGQRPYDDDILSLAVTAVNDELQYDEDMHEVIRSHLWAQASDMFE